MTESPTSGPTISPHLRFDGIFNAMRLIHLTKTQTKPSFPTH